LFAGGMLLNELPYQSLSLFNRLAHPGSEFAMDV